MKKEILSAQKYEESYPVREGRKIIGYTDDNNFDTCWKQLKKVYKIGKRYIYTFSEIEDYKAELIGFQY